MILTSLPLDSKSSHTIPALGMKLIDEERGFSQIRSSGVSAALSGELGSSAPQQHGDVM